MIEDGTGPTDGRMTHLAFKIGSNVLRWLALGRHVVVASRTAPVRLGVVEVNGWDPRYRGMAAITLLR
jgi:hypothetical protein